MDLIDLEDETIDAEVMDSLAVTMDDFRVCGYACVLYYIVYILYPWIERPRPGQPLYGTDLY